MREPRFAEIYAHAAAGTKNAGNVYVATEQRIFQVDPAGQVTTVLTNNSDISSTALTLLAIAPAKTPPGAPSTWQPRPLPAASGSW